jgi:hypothetical protein
MSAHWNSTASEINTYFKKNPLMKILAAITGIFFSSYAIGYTAHFVWGLID